MQASIVNYLCANARLMEKQRVLYDECESHSHDLAARLMIIKLMLSIHMHGCMPIFMLRCVIACGLDRWWYPKWEPKLVPIREPKNRHALCVTEFWLKNEHLSMFHFWAPTMFHFWAPTMFRKWVRPRAKIWNPSRNL